MKLFDWMSLPEAVQALHIEVKALSVDVKMLLDRLPDRSRAPRQMSSSERIGPPRSEARTEVGGETDRKAPEAPGELDGKQRTGRVVKFGPAGNRRLYYPPKRG